MDDNELLVQPHPHPGFVPRYGSYVLAPWVGEVEGGRLYFGGSEYSLPTRDGPHALHGLGFNVPWQVDSHSATSLTLRRELTDPWPFGGRLTQHFEVDDSGVTQTVHVTAGARAMPAALGWHPWFRIPRNGLSRVRTDATHYLELQPDMLPTGEIRLLPGDLNLGVGRELDGTELDIVLLGASRPATLELASVSVEISCDTPPAPAINVLTLYTGAGFACVEPWSSWPNAAVWAARGDARAGQVTLGPRESLRRWMRWSWLNPR